MGMYQQLGNSGQNSPVNIFLSPDCVCLTILNIKLSMFISIMPLTLFMTFA